MFVNRISVFLILFLLAGCQSNKNAVKLNKVYVTDTIPVDLLSPDCITENIEQMQLFEGNFGKNSFSSFLILSADKSKIEILMVNEMGIQIGSVFYDGQECIMDSSFFPKNLKSEYIILDLQNVYADSTILKEHYKKYGIDFVDQGNKRQLIKNGKLIEEITKEEEKITIKNDLRSYTYVLKLLK